MDTVVTYLTYLVRPLSIKYDQNPWNIYGDITHRLAGIMHSPCIVVFIKSASLSEAATSFTSTKFGPPVAWGGGRMNSIGLYLIFLQRFTHKRILTKLIPKRSLLKTEKMFLKIYHLKRS